MRPPPRRAPAPARRRAGFTLLEVLTVLVISATVLGIALLSFGGYFRRVAAARAAEVFAQDLTLARTWALRSREPVVIRFFESGLWYQVEAPGSDTELARRRFGQDFDIDLTAIALELDGDTLVFDERGLVDLSGAGGSLGTATFSSGPESYTVSFNGMGASKIDRT